MAKSTDNRKELSAKQGDPRQKQFEKFALERNKRSTNSSVDELIQLLIGDEGVFGKYVLSERVSELTERRKAARNQAFMGQVRADLLRQAGTSSASGSSLPPLDMPRSHVVRRRLDEIFQNGPRILSENEARELLDDDPEAIAFLRLKLRVNAKDLSEPWLDEFSKLLTGRKAREQKKR